MVSTNYIKNLLKYMKISQSDLAEEWERVSESERGKKQSMVSNLLNKKEGIESYSFIEAVSNLTGIPISDLNNELAYSKDQKSLIYTVSEPKEAYEVNKDNVSIPVVGYKETAKLLIGNSGSGTPNIKDIGQIQLPRIMMSDGIFACVQESGHRMSDTIEDGDYVVYKMIEEEDWQLMIDNYVYLVLTEDGGRYLGRVKNRIRENHLIILYPDNKDSNHKDFVIRMDSVVQVWKAYLNLSYRFPNPNDTINDKFDQVGNDIIEVKMELDRLKAELERARNAK